MNSVIAIAVITSMYLVSVFINKYNGSQNSGITQDNQDDSSLEEDFRDILRFIPIEESRQILFNYFKYDKQLDDTRSFINDQKRFILRELENIPETWMFLKILQNLGLQVDNWDSKIRELWKSLPKFEEEQSTIAAGGFIVMINKILSLIPSEELHPFLCDKMRHSTSFRMFIQALRSPVFIDMCEKIEENGVLARHYYWAKQDEIEVILAVELLKKLYLYLTQGLS
ncbi:uncharacterized protein [Fopius arisanus]|uniref:Uncharacterized protein n=1 Tax=Fopius arisanus TaxID=64838 RepID=A0A9R1TXB1_9HYME|nr:PREDICTED: uncharacterized protein LOC105264534 [Fopius arisanus]